MFDDTDPDLKSKKKVERNEVSTNICIICQ